MANVWRAYCLDCGDSSEPGDSQAVRAWRRLHTADFDSVNALEIAFVKAGEREELDVPVTVFGNVYPGTNNELRLSESALREQANIKRYPGAPTDWVAIRRAYLDGIEGIRFETEITGFAPLFDDVELQENRARLDAEE